MNTYGGVEVQFQAFLTLALNGGVWSAFLLDCFTPTCRALNTHWMGGWVGPEVVLTKWQGEKIPVPASNPTLVLQPSCYTY